MLKRRLKGHQSRAELNRCARDHLREIQKTLMPQHAAEFVAINIATGEYALGSTAHEAFATFRARWPDQMMYRCRVDGGPATKFHGK